MESGLREVKAEDVWFVRLTCFPCDRYHNHNWITLDFLKVKDMIMSEIQTLLGLSYIHKSQSLSNVSKSHLTSDCQSRRKTAGDIRAGPIYSL